MTTINTVSGPLLTADLGHTLMHEHLLVGAPGVFRDYPELYGENPMVRVLTQLGLAKKGGINTIVDLTTLDLGRNVNFLEEASRLSGVNIIATTGWWLDIPRFFEDISVKSMAEVFIREIRDGIAGTNIRAGLLKSASDMEGVSPGARIILRAIAAAHHETGVPIALHSYPAGQVGREQLRILKDEGVELNRVKMDHSNDTTDVEYLTYLLDMGCYLGLDRYPGGVTSSEARTRTMKTLIDAGYADRLCPSHDHLAVMVETESPLMALEERDKRNPHGFMYIKEVVFPRLIELGVAKEIVDNLCVTGPRNFFEGK